MLDPQGYTAAEVIDQWMSCRAAIFNAESRARYCLTDDDVSHLSEHVQRWLDSSTPPGSAGA